MKKNKKIVAICCSASFFQQTHELKRELNKLGFRVKMPQTASEMKKKNNFDVTFYKTWYKNPKDYKKKTKLIKNHFKKITQSDAVLVLNLKKNGVAGYIGMNTLMEMAIAFFHKKPIFIYMPIPKESIFEEEVFGLKSIFINGDLKLLKKYLK